MDSNRLEGVVSVGEYLNLDMSMADFIEVIKKQRLSNENIRTILRELGETLSKNSISNIYMAAGFEVKDARKKIIEPTDQASYNMTLKEAVQLARALRIKNEKQPKQKKIVEPKAVIIEAPAAKTVELGERIYSNPFSIERAAEAKDFILAALELTHNEFESIRNLIHSNNEFNSNPFESESIYESIKQLKGRERTNKTYYISKEVIDLVAEFAEEKSIKVSQFVEIALLEAMRKYKN